MILWEQEGRLEILLSTLITKSWRSMYRWNRWYIACIWSSLDGGEVDMPYSFLCHHSTVMFYFEQGWFYPRRNSTLTCTCDESC